jgi:hypothetical protein
MFLILHPLSRKSPPDLERIMKRQIRIKAGSLTALAELNDTKTADGIWQALPFRGNSNTWGEEIYFAIPMKMELEPPGQQLVNSGDLGYWPPGSAFCIFFGPTPISRGAEIRAASPVAIFGRLVDDPKMFRKIKDGEQIAVERV